jgi:hypothetical protein
MQPDEQQPERVTKEVTLPQFMVIGLIQARLNNHPFQVPPDAAIAGIKMAPELFHYRALRSGRLLAWDLRMDKALTLLEEVFPPLAHALKQSPRLLQSEPFAAIDREGSSLHYAWQKLKADIANQGPIVDTTISSCEPIYSDEVPEIAFLDTDAALDQLNEAYQMDEGPERTQAIASAQSLLARLTP